MRTGAVPAEQRASRRIGRIARPPPDDPARRSAGRSRRIASATASGERPSVSTRRCPEA